MAVLGVMLADGIAIAFSQLHDKAWDQAIQRKWAVVDMKDDWKVVFPFEMK